MKIFSINLFKLNKNNNKYNNSNPNNTLGINAPNTVNYAQNCITPNLLKTPLQQDTVSFSGKIPSIVTPTMDDLINRTKAVDILRFNILRLAKYDVPCPCCGHIMLDVDKFKEFEKKVLETTDPGELLDLIGSLKKYLHPVEKKMYSIMRAIHAQKPDMSIHKMLKAKLKISEKKIVMEQSNILTSIGLLSKHLPEQESKEIQALIGETYERLFDKRETSRFGRRVFIAKLEEILKDSKNEAIKSRIIEKSLELPAAYNNVDAFIVKYAKRNYNGANPDQKIALRMLSNSLATIEHIKPTKLKGSTSPENLALECAADNNRRNHMTVIEQIVENPDMIINYNKYMNRLVELHLMRKLEKEYIRQTNKTYSIASCGMLDADLSRLRYAPKVKKLDPNEGVTPTKEERRAIRKENLKRKKHLPRK